MTTLRTDDDDELIGTFTQSIVSHVWGDIPGPNRPVVAAVRKGVCAAIEASGLLKERDEARNRGQAEGCAAAVQWLRDRSAMKPPAPLWHAANLLADQLEQSRIPRAALTEKHNG